jgi:hypothetical protein
VVGLPLFTTFHVTKLTPGSGDNPAVRTLIADS